MRARSVTGEFYAACAGQIDALRAVPDVGLHQPAAFETYLLLELCSIVFIA